MNGLAVKSMTNILTKPYRRGAEILELQIGADAGGWTPIMAYDFSEYKARYDGNDPHDPKYIIYLKSEEDTGVDDLELEVEYSFGGNHKAALKIPPHTIPGTSFIIPVDPSADHNLRLKRFRQIPIALNGAGADNWGIVALLGNIAKLSWVLGWEKDHMQQYMLIIRGQRRRSSAHAYSLDLLGKDLKIPRFPPREYSFDADTIALYHLNEFVPNNGIVADETKRFGLAGHPGKNIGAQSDTAGKFGSGFLFPGPSSSGTASIEIPAHADFNIAADKDFTIEAFVKAEAKDGTTPCCLIMRGTVSSAGALTGVGWSLFLGTFRGIQNNVRWAATDGTNKFEIFADTNIADGTFHHVAGILNRSRKRAYLLVDGQRLASADISSFGSIINNRLLVIGRSNTGHQFSGVIDEVRCSSVARTDFHPVLGESDEAYRKRLGLFERWLLPTPDVLTETINDLVQINGVADSFVLIEKDRPGANASKVVRIIPAALAAGQSIDRYGNMRSKEIEVSGVPEDDVDFKEIHFIRHDHPQISYGADEDHRRMQETTSRTLNVLLDLLALSGISDKVIIEKSLDQNDTGLHRVGRALLMRHETLSLEEFEGYVRQAGFDGVRRERTALYASVGALEDDIEFNEIYLVNHNQSAKVDYGTDENNHLMQAAIRRALEALLDILAGSAITNKLIINKSFDPSDTGLHRVGRALFMSHQSLLLEDLGVYAHRAGFDYVLHDGANIYTSVAVGEKLDIIIEPRRPSDTPPNGIEVFDGKKINLHVEPENLPTGGLFSWTLIKCGAGRASLESHPLDAALRTPVTSRPRLSLVADAPGEITLRVEYAYQRRTVTGTRTILISIETLQDREIIAANGQRGITESEAVGPVEDDFDPLYLITHDASLKKMQIVLEKPLNRLLELLGPSGMLKILKAYDPLDPGLHKVGRALVLQHTIVNAESLGARAHQAGFGFVQRRGNQIYCSVAAGEKIEIVRSDLAPLEEELTADTPVDLRVRFSELPMPRLFQIATSFQADLDNGVISTGLRTEFSNNGSTLSAHATVSTLESTRRWIIIDIDNDKRYILIKAGSTINVHLQTGSYNWSTSTIGHGRGSFDRVLRPEVTFTPAEPGMLLLNTTYLKQDAHSTFPYTCEIKLKDSLDRPQTIIPKHQYDLIMNILNYFHPIGIEVITRNIREHVVEVKGNLMNAFPGYTYPDFKG